MKVGSKVRIVEKRNQPSGKLTDGIVRRILTSSSNHHHGIKVQLENGLVGRVKEIISGVIAKQNPMDVRCSTELGSLCWLGLSLLSRLSIRKYPND